MNLKKIKLEYKWIVAAACFLMVFTVLGFCSSSKSVYIAAITEALGISRSVFSINDSCRYVTTAVANLFFGVLISRFGERKLIAAGFASLIISCVLYSVGRSIYVFYIGGIFLGLGLSWTTTTMVGAVIGKWFKEKRGTVMGAVLAANGVGAALAIQVVTPVIYQEGTLFGYRDAYSIVALILLVVGIIVVSLVKGNKDSEEKVDTKKKPKGKTWVGLTFGEIIKKPYFYGALICIFLTGMVLQGISGVAAPLLRDVGLSDEYVATVLSVHALALTLFKLGCGVLYDKFGLRRTVNVCYVTAMLVMIALSLVTKSPAGMILAMFYGIFSSLALPLETIMLPICTGELFGENSYNKILGIVVAVNSAGYAMGAPLANLSYDLLGTYNPALYISAGLMVVIMIIMNVVIKITRREKERAEIM
ncbi:MAG: MFS transporter [Clostridia bacterium]|nr:MFS transporter [Clostridia bacterium]